MNIVAALFFTLLFLPVGSDAQQVTRVPRVGWMWTGSASTSKSMEIYGSQKFTWASAEASSPQEVVPCWCHTPTNATHTMDTS
jgi:hypothetical protein